MKHLSARWEGGGLRIREVETPEFELVTYVPEHLRGERCPRESVEVSEASSGRFCAESRGVVAHTIAAPAPGDAKRVAVLERLYIEAWGRRPARHPGAVRLGADGWEP